MFSKGDTVFYGSHGVCAIEDIQDQTFSGVKKSYYILRSYRDASLKLFHPVETENPKLTPIASKEKAKIILDTFKNAPSHWPERVNERSQYYEEILENENHIQIAQMMNTILRKQIELEREDKKLTTIDLQMVKNVSSILYEELAISLEVSIDEVKDKIDKIILENL